jgi:hypothetical protein
VNRTKAYSPVLQNNDGGDPEEEGTPNEADDTTLLSERKSRREQLMREVAIPVQDMRPVRIVQYKIFGV